MDKKNVKPEEKCNMDGKRDCPKCGESTAYVKGSSSEGAAWLELKNSK